MTQWFNLFYILHVQPATADQPYCNKVYIFLILRFQTAVSFMESHLNIPQ